MEGKRNSRQEQKWTKRLRGGILAGVLPVRDAKQQPGLRVTLSTRTSYPGEGSYNTERPILLGPINGNWRCPGGQENGERVDLRFPLTYTITVKLLCMIQWWIHVIRPLGKPTECRPPRVSPDVNYGLQGVIMCQCHGL